MNARVNAFADLKEVPVFQTKPRPEKPVAKDVVDRIAKDNNFPSRQAPKATPTRKPRIYRTGRNQHLGIKATPEAHTRFYKMADERGVVLGELLELALDALDKETRAGGAGS